MIDYGKLAGCNDFGHTWIKDFYDGASIPSIRCYYCGINPDENGARN